MQNKTSAPNRTSSFAAQRASKRHLNIVGISAGYHDSACCLIQDGNLIAAVQEERFSRVKNDKSFPRRAFRYCLQQAGLTITDLDCVAYYEDPISKLGRQIWMGIQDECSSANRQQLLDRLVEPPPETLIRKKLGFEGPIEIVEHHLSHAASSYYFSGFEDASILTVDGVGEWATTTYGWGKGPEITRYEQVDFPHSLGFFYSAVTGYLGFEVNEGEYKVMGLAPYGKPLYVNQLRKMIESGELGQFRINPKYFGFMSGESMFTEELSALLGKPNRTPESEILQFHMDVARSAQAVLEEIMLEKVKYMHDRFPSDNLCMAGGVALNVVANSACLKHGPFKKMFVQPAAGDAGGALGASAVAHVRLTGQAPAVQTLNHVYLGPENASQEIHQILKASAAEHRDFRGRVDELIGFTVDRLLEGKVIGWVHGRLEFGPRSLGARSILADARQPGMRDRINEVVKMRESFRPFAPAVLEQKAHEHFELDHPSPFMLEVCPVISEIDLPSITHVDRSARIQTVNSETSPRFAALLEEFDRRTGCPVLLNTSFNMRGEPIVCSAIDAILCFVRCRIDVLILEDFAIERAQIPALWELLAAQKAAEKPGEDAAVKHLVYTLL
jgi:carbamoyltransferase